MKNRLTAIFNTLKEVETKGDSTLRMADCLRELVDVINNMPNDVPQEVPEQPAEQSYFAKDSLTPLNYAYHEGVAFYFVSYIFGQKINYTLLISIFI